MVLFFLAFASYSPSTFRLSLINGLFYDKRAKRNNAGDDTLFDFLNASILLHFPPQTVPWRGRRYETDGYRRNGILALAIQLGVTGHR